MVWVVRRRGRAEMLLGSDAAKVLKWWKWWKMDSLRGRVGGVESLFTRWQHTRGDARGTDGWRTFFFTAASSKGGERKGGVLLCGVGFSPIAGMVPVVGVQCIEGQRPSRATMAHQHKTKGPTASLSYPSYPDRPLPALVGN